ncbi:MAG: hypothetical protein IMZ62_12700 [Chloroflexi bacterium]|nr:hypothetical protein [Chloroflexota bacterium]MBE3117522.1 hypothetical protein [Candidatus Atribacteria bacterium]
MKSKRIRIGDYNLGIHLVKLFADPDLAGGTFDMGPDDKGNAEICVGLDRPRWEQVVGAALHEAMEFALIQVCVRYQPAPDFSSDNGGLMFFATHSQFSEATARAGCFLCACLPPLAMEYNRCHKRRTMKGGRK